MIFLMISGNSMTYGRPEIVLIFTVLVLASEKVITRRIIFTTISTFPTLPEKCVLFFCFFLNLILLIKALKKVIKLMECDTRIHVFHHFV